ncbi:MAG: hypothetical protein KA007_03165 [Candidatus Pacebacteria bacterium]|nr:hypothetical protein [Candidatus Paceibacterota bacterium]
MANDVAVEPTVSSNKKIHLGIGTDVHLNQGQLKELRVSEFKKRDFVQEFAEKNRGGKSVRDYLDNFFSKKNIKFDCSPGQMIKDGRQEEVKDFIKGILQAHGN